MKSCFTRRWKRILTAIMLYLFFCGFLWCFLLVETRSHNRLSHTPVVMAHIQLDTACVTCTLADKTMYYPIPAANDTVCFWTEVLSDPTVSIAAALWKLLG